MIHLLRQPATAQQVKEMLEEHGVAIKVVVDTEREVMTGGGEYHADGDKLLRADGSRPENLWGATWYLDGRIRFDSVLNLKAWCGNFRIDVQSPERRRRMEAIIRRILEHGP